jgi:Tfp pilus assembly protein PilF
MQRKIPRAEYALGRILEAKGNAAGAREHMSKYLDLDKNAPDAELIRAHMENMGKPDAAGTEPELEPL